MRVLVPLAPPMSKFGTVSPSYGCRPFCSSPYLYQECVTYSCTWSSASRSMSCTLVQVAVDDRAARHHQVARAVVVGLDRQVAVRHQELRRQAAADRRPVLVETGDRDQVGDVDVVDELDGAVDDPADHVQPFHVDRADRACRVHVDRRRHAADQPVRVRVAAAENRLDLHDFLLEVERFEVVRDGHQVGFRRQLVGRVTPVAVAERPELSRLDELLQAVLQVAEVARRRQRPARDRLRQFRRRLRVRRERAHHVHPVEGVQVIEVHQVIL